MQSPIVDVMNAQGEGARRAKPPQSTRSLGRHGPFPMRFSMDEDSFAL